MYVYIYILCENIYLQSLVSRHNHETYAQSFVSDVAIGLHRRIVSMPGEEERWEWSQSEEEYWSKDKARIKVDKLSDLDPMTYGM